MNQDLYQDTRYGQQVGNYTDYGLYWVKKNVKPDVIVEFHLEAEVHKQVVHMSS